MILNGFFHSSVLLSEVVEGLKVKPKEKYIDATIGGGGLTDEILRRGGIVLGIDADENAIRYVENKLKIQSRHGGTKFKINKDLFLKQGNFADLKKIANKYGFNRVAGVLFDLGMSTYQLEHSGRGFSFKVDEPLDMRMDRRIKTTAADIVNTYSSEELYEIFTKYAEELNSLAIARACVRARSLKKKILRTNQLRDLLWEITDSISVGASDMQKLGVFRKMAARIFQALRIVVNDELENLKKGLSQAIDLLKPEGRLAVLSFHSLEDRLVKIRFKDGESKGYLHIVTKTPIEAGWEEIKINSASRSAKLRIAQKL
jgi:16S rRNA (cytosine1402-N4)-methyltransferase